MKKILLTSCIVFSLNAMNIRPLDKDNSHEVYQLQCMVNAAKSEFEEPLHSQKLDIYYLKGVPQRRTINVLEVDKEIVGFISFTTKNPHWLFECFQNPEGEIELIGIKKTATRSNNYAELLLQNAINKMEDKVESIVVFMDKNADSDLYEHEGFTKVNCPGLLIKKLVLDFCDDRLDPKED